MELKFPSFSEYQTALQHPRLCFKHYPLNQGEIEVDLWGLPRVRSGGFALTYKLTDHSKKLAVRCFYRSLPDRMHRYFEISRFIEGCGSPALVPVCYLSRGIQVQGKPYPVTYMEWIESATLDEWLVKNHARKAKLLAFVEEFIRLSRDLETLGIAHGDLSHRNILYNGNQAVLIDYDGMYVPALRGRKACELGNPYFQHPGRKIDFFNAELDRFSEIVIYLALMAIALQPELYRLFETGGEGLLFTKKDFQHPYQSAVLREIEKIPELKGQVQNFREICLGSLSETPRLEDFLNQQTFERVRSEISSAVEEEVELPRLVFQAEERKAILRWEGQIVQVVGQVTEVHCGRRIEGQPHVFVNFGSWRKKCFTIVLWDQALRDFLETMGDPGDLKGKWISVKGLLTLYNYRPQISLASLSEIMILESPEIGSVILRRPVNTAVEAPEPKPVSRAVVDEKVKEVESPGHNQCVKLTIQGARLDRSMDVVARIDQLYK